MLELRYAMTSIKAEARRQPLAFNSAELVRNLPDMLKMATTPWLGSQLAKVANKVCDSDFDDLKDRAAQAMTPKGGAARGSNPTSEQRRKISRKAAAKQWIKSD